MQALMFDVLSTLSWRGESSRDEHTPSLVILQLRFVLSLIAAALLGRSELVQWEPLHAFRREQHWWMDG
jgi:hypothetical protein